MRRYVEALLADAHRVEVRLLPSGKSEAFTDVDKVLAHVGQVAVGNVYTTLNRPRADATVPFGNESIQHLVRLVFDFDPVRPADSAATGWEMSEAQRVGQAFVQSMMSAGWPMPLMGSSGNGAHVVYRTFAVNTPEVAEMLRVVYHGLHRDWSTDTVQFDRSVRNAGRVWRLYGSVNRKGVSTAERPHRVAVCRIPADWQRVDLRLVERLANRYAVKPSARFDHERPRVSGRGDFSTLDVVGWFGAHGLYRGHLHSNVHEVDCPWEGEHTTRNRADTIIYADDGRGWPGFFCHHQHCTGRSIRDVIALWGDADQFCARQWGAA